MHDLWFLICFMYRLGTARSEVVQMMRVDLNRLGNLSESYIMDLAQNLLGNSWVINEVFGRRLRNKLRTLRSIIVHEKYGNHIPLRQE